jgi:hypothetical protein
LLVRRCVGRQPVRRGARTGHRLSRGESRGDEFCALLPTPSRTEDLHALVSEAAGSLAEQGETFAVKASCGAVLVPHEATTPEYARQLADERTYARKRSRSTTAQEQAHEVLVRIMHAKQPKT